MLMLINFEYPFVLIKKLRTLAKANWLATKCTEIGMKAFEHSAKSLFWLVVWLGGSLQPGSFWGGG